MSEPIHYCQPYEKMPSYKAYKNLMFKKNIDRMRNLLMNIDSSPLKPEDKRNLKGELAKVLNSNIFI